MKSLSRLLITAALLLVSTSSILALPLPIIITALVHAGSHVNGRLDQQTKIFNETIPEYRKAHTVTLSSQLHAQTSLPEFMKASTVTIQTRPIKCEIVPVWQVRCQYRPSDEAPEVNEVVNLNFEKTSLMARFPLPGLFTTNDEYRTLLDDTRKKILKFACGVICDRIQSGKGLFTGEPKSKPGQKLDDISIREAILKCLI